MVIFSATWGAPIPFADLWSSDAKLSGPAWQIFGQIRPPRTLAALLVGANLAASGAALQIAFRNPLAEPYLLGTSSGGALGAVLALWLRPSAPADATSFAALNDIGIVSACAFIGALLSSALVYRLGARRGGRALVFDRAALLLSGVALSSLLSSAMSLIVSLSSRTDLAQQITFWLLGGLSGATFAHDIWLLISLVVGLILMMSATRDLNAMALGDEEARALGVSVSGVQKRLLLAAALMSAGAVATAGLIGFVGLLAPHAMRKLFGNNARILIPTAAIGGAILLCACDSIARSVAPPIEIPVGIVTALLGVPLFLWLLRKDDF